MRCYSFSHSALCCAASYGKMVLWKKFRRTTATQKQVRKTNSKIEVRRKLKATARKVFFIFANSLRRLCNSTENKFQDYAFAW